MRLLIATDYYPPFIGGAHRQSRLLALGMAARGHHVEVVTGWHKGFPSELDEGITVHRVRQMRTAFRALVRDPGQRHQPPFPDPVTVLALRRVIASSRPDVIHVYGWLSFSMAGALLGKRIPLLLSARDYGYFCATRTLARKGRQPCSGPGPAKCVACAGDYYGAPRGWIAVAGVAASRPLLMRRTTAIHAVSTYVQDVTRQHLPQRRGAGPLEFTIPSFQDVAPDEELADRPEVLAQLEQLPDEPFILFVGAFRKIKGLEVLFDAYRRLTNPPPLVLVGTYERDSPASFPAEAVVLEDLPHRAVLSVWDRAMFGVMPSLLPEPLGAVVAEGMSRGKPVIGTRPGGHVDMLDETCGILVDQGDPVALADAMAALIYDPARREAYGRAARVRWGAFSASTVLPRFEQAYRDVLATATAR